MASGAFSSLRPYEGRTNERFMIAGEAEVSQWLSPKTKRKTIQRDKGKASTAKWDREIAIFLVAVLTGEGHEYS